MCQWDESCLWGGVQILLSSQQVSNLACCDHTLLYFPQHKCQFVSVWCVFSKSLHACVILGGVCVPDGREVRKCSSISSLLLCVCGGSAGCLLLGAMGSVCSTPSPWPVACVPPSLYLGTDCLWVFGSVAVFGQAWGRAARQFTLLFGGLLTACRACRVP